MDFEFTEEQRALQESTRGLLVAKAPLETTRGLLSAADDFDAKLWQYGVELGWPALAIAEDDGGLGQQLADLVIVAVEHGRFLVPSPFIPTVIAAEALAGAVTWARRSELLTELLDGSATAAWAFGEFRRSWAVESLGLLATATPDGGYVLSGEKTHVQDGGSADWLLVDAVLDGQPARFVVSGDSVGLSLRREETLDVTRAYYDIRFDEVVVPAEGLLTLGRDAVKSITRSTQMSSVLACGELVGAGERMLAMTVEHARERVQFGRAIGSFQAVKHKCATMKLWVQASTAATYYAAMSVAAHGDAAREVSVAKAYTSDAICRIAGEALQLHGGIGFTWEHDLHLYIRRARTNALLYGDAARHRELLCRMLECTGAESNSSPDLDS